MIDCDLTLYLKLFCQQSTSRFRAFFLTECVKFFILDSVCLSCLSQQVHLTPSSRHLLPLLLISSCPAPHIHSPLKLRTSPPQRAPRVFSLLMHKLVSPEENEILKAETMLTHLYPPHLANACQIVGFPRPGLCYGEKYFLNIFLLRTNDINL